jgi:hypothetical protein
MSERIDAINLGELEERARHSDFFLGGANLSRA